MTPHEMQSIIDKAGLHNTEAAKLFDNITRQTLANWLKGVPPKNRSIYTRAQKTCQMLQMATERKLLPLAAGTPQKERFRLILDILRMIMKN